jgi:hypothetical protein
MTNSIWVKTNDGQFIQVNRLPQVTPEDRIYDFVSHTEKVVTLLYSMDEGNYDYNTENVLYLMGESGKEIIQGFDSEGLKNFLIANNAVSKVDSIQVQFDMTTYPEPGYATGKVTFKQIFVRSGVAKARYGESTFTIYDVIRLEKNLIGAKLDNFKPVFYEK